MIVIHRAKLSYLEKNNNILRCWVMANAGFLLGRTIWRKYGVSKYPPVHHLQNIFEVHTTIWTSNESRGNRHIFVSKSRLRQQAIGAKSPSEVSNSSRVRNSHEHGVKFCNHVMIQSIFVISLFDVAFETSPVLQSYTKNAFLPF